MPKLVVISDEMKDRTFELSEDKITIGRLPDNQIRLEDNAVSSHHAVLTRKGEDYLIRDLNSTNGTRVNGQRIVEMRLYHGDIVNLGHLQVQYFSRPQTAPQPLPSPLKKTVDLSNLSSSSVRKTTFGSASPFGRKGSAKSKRILQGSLIALGFILVVFLVYSLIRIFGN